VNSEQPRRTGAAARDIREESSPVIFAPTLWEGEHPSSPAEAGTDEQWRDCADRGIAELARRGQPFQAFDLCDLGVPEPEVAELIHLAPFAE
jgi:hypothetical protein